MDRPARRAPAGFTLVELMISLVIIGVMAMAVAPSLSELLADNRQNSAAWDIVRLARRTRATTTLTGVAHLMVFRNDNTEDAGNGLGSIWVYAGMNNKCAQTPWNLAVTNAFNPIERFVMFPYNPVSSSALPSKSDTGRHVIFFELRVGTDTATPINGLRICYQPNGEVWSAESVPTPLNNMSPAQLGPQATPYLLSVRRTIDSAQRGVTGGRQVLFPVGGQARLR